MWPARVRGDQHVLPEMQIVLDVAEAATLHPSPVGRWRKISPPTVLTPPVEDDRYLLALPERVL
jgi:hypothetical protein